MRKLGDHTDTPTELGDTAADIQSREKKEQRERGRRQRNNRLRRGRGRKLGVRKLHRKKLTKEAVAKKDQELTEVKENGHRGWRRGWHI